MIARRLAGLAVRVLEAPNPHGMERRRRKPRTGSKKSQARRVWGAVWGGDGRSLWDATCASWRDLLEDGRVASRAQRARLRVKLAAGRQAASRRRQSRRRGECARSGVGGGYGARRGVAGLRDVSCELVGKSALCSVEMGRAGAAAGRAGARGAAQTWQGTSSDLPCRWRWPGEGVGYTAHRVNRVGRVRWVRDGRLAVVAWRDGGALCSWILKRQRRQWAASQLAARSTAQHAVGMGDGWEGHIEPGPAHGIITPARAWHRKGAALDRL